MARKKIARTKRSTKRTTGKPVDQEIRRAAERAGIPPRVTEEQRAQQDLEARARDQVARAIAPSLILACEQLSEEIAAIAQSCGGAGKGGDDHNVVDALLSIWRVRWELGLTPTVGNDDADEGEQAAGDAS